MSIGKFKKDELRSIADELKLVVPDNAKVLDLRELIQESEIYKNDKETYQAIVDCVLEEINDRRNEDENRRNENENRLEIEKIKLSHVKTCCAKNCFCGKPHNRLIHFLKRDNQTVQRSVLNPLADVFGGPGGSNCVVPPQGENEENKSFVATSFLKNKTRTVLLSSVQCFLRDKYGLLHEVRALLDVGSQSHFITKDCADRLQLKNEKINLLVSCLNESTMTINGGVTTSIFNGDFSFKKELNLLVVRRITDLTPSQIINVSLDMPNEIKLADYKFNIPGKIDVLLGAEIFYELLRPGQIYCGDSRLLLQNTVFGYVVSGSVGDELESIGVKNENCSEEDVSFEMFKQRVHFKNGRYEVELPWKRDSNELSDNFSLAKRRLGSLMRKMQRDKVLYSEYCKVLKNYLDEGIIEKVTNPFIPTNNPVFYLPHQVIIKNESLTTKLRLVFDASAHAEKQLSLNDCLFHGVNLNPNILDLLISFRSNKIAVLADVEKAFLQISLAPKDRDVVRFLIDDGENGVQVYRFNRVLLA
ncbi:integrase catalytic domain-containing protein [Trichonephila clavipes]|nr:integrase catalytic domain-containing protein [Trichonephila clavipes]